MEVIIGRRSPSELRAEAPANSRQYERLGRKLYILHLGTEAHTYSRGRVQDK